jgi:hypothetical protein
MNLHHGHALLLNSFSLVNERFVDVRNNTTPGNGSLDQGIQFLITANSELQMTGSDTLHLKILGGVTCQLEYLCRKLKRKGKNLVFKLKEFDGR